MLLFRHIYKEPFNIPTLHSWDTIVIIYSFYMNRSFQFLYQYIILREEDQELYK